MNKLAAFVASLFLVCLAAAADAPAPSAPPKDAVLFDHAKVDDAFAKGSQILITTSYKIQAGRRVKAGNVEVHEHDTDIFYVTEGSATFVTGGIPVGAQPVGAGEIRADTITGGVTHHLTKGDVIVVPSGVPHWFTEVSGAFVYLVVKVTK